MSAAVKRWGFSLIVAFLILVGLIGAGASIAGWIVAGVGAAALLAVWKQSWWGIAVVVGHLLGAVLIGFLALVGFDVLVNLAFKAPCLDDARLPIWVGLTLALAVFGIAVYWYLNRAGWHRYWSTLAACELAFVLIVAAPYVYGKIEASKDPILTASPPVPSKLDVLIVGDGRPRSALPDVPRTPSLGEFEVSYSVGYADGPRVRWTLVNGEEAGQALHALAGGRRRATLATAPRIRKDADSSLLLLVDGTAPVSENPALLPDRPYQTGEVERWRAVAADAAPAKTPTYALVQTTKTGRLARWERFSPVGRVVSVQSLESQTATDAAVRLAVGAPTAQADFSLAMKYRPILLFDRSEPVPWPLSISGLFEEGRVRLCHDEGVAGTDCGSGPIAHTGELENGGTHLRLKLRGSRELRRLAELELASQRASAEAGAPASLGAAPAATPSPGTEQTQSTATPAGGSSFGTGSAIYVHPVAVQQDGREMLFLDYWWYLPDNPVSLGGGAFCGAGLVIAGVTCHSHQSDWEGLTVVVDRGGEKPRVVAVQYAQHNSVIRYPWRTLRRRWNGNSKTKDAIAGIDGASVRPLAFVASGTHATYPDACARCFQLSTPEVKEESHLGGLPWVGDYTGACGESSCLLTLPTRLAGSAPALWNAFEGTWGEVHCFLTYYCDSGKPPTAPGAQGRYKHPAHYSGAVDSRWRYQPLP